MTLTLEGGCRVSNLHDGGPLAEGSLRIWNQVSQATGAQAISLRIMEFAPGLSPGILNEECDEILYVINLTSGADTDRNELGTAGGWINLLIDGRTYQVHPDSGVYIRPGNTYTIDNPGPGSIIVISSQCPDPDRAPQFVSPWTSVTLDSETAIPSPIVGL